MSPVAVPPSAALGQRIIPGGHTAPHVPLAQTWSAGHAWPQVPQLALSAIGEMHRLLQVIWPDGQMSKQTPSLQLSPEGHVWPHCPQFSGSLFVEVHREPHWRWVPGH
jgi:hypothetical protein